jgi:pimeloyl-ACP methyl ester carboxylesterase
MPSSLRTWIVARRMKRVAIFSLLALLSLGCAVRDFRAAQQQADAGGEDHFLLDGPGRFSFVVAPGSYKVAAWADLDGNGVYDREPVLDPALAPVHEVGAGERIGPLELSIPAAELATAAPIDVIGALRARSLAEQEHISLGQGLVAGAVTSLDDARFGREAAVMGLRRRVQFVENGWFGIYFQRPYAPSEIPVLFVHGMTGSAREFASLAGSLPDGFQPWFFHYPSGADLSIVSLYLGELLRRLRYEYGFEQLVVVAHSMGGLVVRHALVNAEPGKSPNSVKLFVSISTPWGGMPSAEQLARSPDFAVEALRPPPALLQVARGGDFLTDLFYADPAKRRARRRLPTGIDYRLVFSLDDTVVPVSSALRTEAQEDAHWRIRGLPYDHAEILQSPEATAALNAILESSEF